MAVPLRSVWLFLSSSTELVDTWLAPDGTPAISAMPVLAIFGGLELEPFSRRPSREAKSRTRKAGEGAPANAVTKSGGPGRIRTYNQQIMSLLL